MKKFLLGTVALIALGATVPALAADLAARPYTKAPPAVYAPIYNWTGFYIGGHIGGAFSGNNGFAGTTNGSDDGRFLGGLQVGADYQFAPNWVVGIEGPVVLARQQQQQRCLHGPGAGFVYNNDQRGLGSVTGRIGYTWGPALLYVKGGYAYSDNARLLTFLGGTAGVRDSTAAITMATPSAPVSNTCSPRTGRPRSSISTTTSARPASSLRRRWNAFGSTRNDEHTVKAGINYRFNWGGPVVAKY